MGVMMFSGGISIGMVEASKKALESILNTYHIRDSVSYDLDDVVKALVNDRMVVPDREAALIVIGQLINLGEIEVSRVHARGKGYYYLVTPLKGENDEH